MYVIMCKVYIHDKKKSTLKASYPVFSVKTEKEIHKWMAEEPEKIVDHLKILYPEQTWEIGDRDNSIAHIWNKQDNLERIYYAEDVSKGELL